VYVIPFGFFGVYSCIHDFNDYWAPMDFPLGLNYRWITIGPAMGSGCGLPKTGLLVFRT
jgi:hypothetical protein